MSRFIIRGGMPLFGDVSVGGSKNAALPIIFASLMTNGTSRISNLPDISDVKIALEIISELGASVSKVGNVTFINTENVKYCLPNRDNIASLRASTYLIGACLARFGRAELFEFGGCRFADRPIDLHIKAAISFGAELSSKTLLCPRLTPADIDLSLPSVGATVNALLMAAAARGTSHIRGAAREAHIKTLADYLRRAGAEITFDKDGFTVTGCELHGADITIPGDPIEAGTYLSLSLVTGGDIGVRGFYPLELAPFFGALSSVGVFPYLSGGAYHLAGVPTAPIYVTAAPSPAFPTDLQPIMVPVMARYLGGSVTDTVWRTRFGYLSELSRHGVISSLSGNTAKIEPSSLAPADTVALDLRGGASVILTALAAKGVSTVASAELCLRGYSDLRSKLEMLGAQIEYA